jgi:hypothetical protein
VLIQVSLLNPEGPVGGSQPEPSISIGPLKDQELMAKGDDLGVERGSSPEALSYREKTKRE